MKSVIRIFDVFLAVCICIVFSLIAIGNSILPSEITAYSTKDITLKSIYSIENNSSDLVDYQGNQRVSSDTVDIKLFGVIPVKSATVSNESAKKVYVSGESFGIKMYTDGVIIVGTKDITVDGKTYNPAKSAGLEQGDIIISINGTKVYCADEVEDILNDNNGNDYVIKVKRNVSYKTFTLTPIYSASEGCYKAGIWVRDSTAGIGTITFYNPTNSVVAALGHPITDVDTNEIMPILNGQAVKVTVTDLYKSSNGEAGSLVCDFSNDVIGELKSNTQCGIYGTYECEIENKYLYEVASAQEVEKGFAQILCTIDDEGPKLYSVEITRVSYKEGSVDKNLVIKIIDDDLIEKTGGIVQGMSGSPIIQNGKLVGALTHVVVDNTIKGYGIFAQTMLEQSENI